MLFVRDGFVYLPTAAPWLTQYVTEITTFPYAKYDDQVDSTSLQGLQTKSTP